LHWYFRVTWTGLIIVSCRWCILIAFYCQWTSRKTMMTPLFHEISFIISWLTTNTSYKSSHGHIRDISALWMLIKYTHSVVFIYGISMNLFLCILKFTTLCWNWIHYEWMNWRALDIRFVSDAVIELCTAHTMSYTCQLICQLIRV
jgi:hypothetical protein